MSSINNERTVKLYNDKMLTYIENQYKRINAAIENLYIDGVTIYDNQLECAIKIVDNFKNLNIIGQAIIGKTQSGKTGVILAIIQEYIKYNIIPIDNIFIISGLSMIEWKIQIKSRLPVDLHNHIYHRNEIKTLFKKEINKINSNILIIIDEVHIANKINQDISKTFNDLGLLDPYKLLTNDIKIVQISATLESIPMDLKSWGTHSTDIIKFIPSKNYISCTDLLKYGYVYEYKALYSNSKEKHKNLESINSLIDEIELFDSYKYHIIRLDKYKKIESYIINIINNRNISYDIFNYDNDCMPIHSKTGDTIDINLLISRIPKKHTIIFIKERLRAAITLLNKKHLGILYERFTKDQNNTTIIQSLIGRVTGYYDDIENIINNVYKFKVYTSIDAIKQYEKYWNTTYLNYYTKKQTYINAIGLTINSSYVVSVYTALPVNTYIITNNSYDELKIQYKKLYNDFKLTTIPDRNYKSPINPIRNQLINIEHNFNIEYTIKPESAWTKYYNNTLENNITEIIKRFKNNKSMHSCSISYNETNDITYIIIYNFNRQNN